MVEASGWQVLHSPEPSSSHLLSWFDRSLMRSCSSQMDRVRSYPHTYSSGVSAVKAHGEWHVETV